MEVPIPIIYMVIDEIGEMVVVLGLNFGVTKDQISGRLGHM